jgi:hypothetical protein
MARNTRRSVFLNVSVSILLSTWNFSLRLHVQKGSGAHTASYPVGPGALSLGLESDHTPPTSAEVKKSWSSTSTLPNTLSWLGAQLKHRDNFTFTSTFTVPDRIRT